MFARVNNVVDISICENYLVMTLSQNIENIVNLI